MDYKTATDVGTILDSNDPSHDPPGNPAGRRRFMPGPDILMRGIYLNART